ncbi:DUF6684 family protein [Halonotius roseus]|uniref:DUF6684 family protein n=1 Tax=Halonotius roseus TaxID=2511997 RepID=UPI002AA2A97A|nr:DUF6684 family protein [Halonotius roseus]
METKIFDRETMLDLVVNFIPLGIILFFIGVFVVVMPWGFDVRTSGVMLGLMIVPFVALAVLTYLSAKAIAGDEKTKPVYAQGQAGLEEAEPEHHGDDESAETAADAVDAGDGGDDDAEDAAEDEDSKDVDDEDGAKDADDDGANDVDDAEGTDSDSASDTDEDADTETTKPESDDTDDEPTDT